jgi:MFS family permease
MVGATLISKALPSLLLSPFSGILVDRVNKKKLMLWSDIIRGCGVLFFLLADQWIGIIFVMNAVLGIVGIFFNPASSAVTPSIVSKKDLTTANSLKSTVNGLMVIIGASLGGMVSSLVSGDAAIVIDSITFFISAYLIWISGIPEPKRRLKDITFWDDLKGGYQFIQRSQVVKTIIQVGISWGFCGGAYQILLTIYGARIFDSGEAGIGMLYALQGLGVVIGGWIVSRYVADKERLMKMTYGWAYFFQGVFFLLFAISTNLFVGATMLLLMRIFGGIIIPLDTTLIQNHTTPENLGKVFALHFSLYGAITQFSMFLTGLFMDLYPPQNVGIVFGGLCILTSLLWLYRFYRNQLDSVDLLVSEDRLTACTEK